MKTNLPKQRSALVFNSILTGSRTFADRREPRGGAKVSTDRHDGRCQCGAQIFDGECWRGC